MRRRRWLVAVVGLLVLGGVLLLWSVLAGQRVKIEAPHYAVPKDNAYDDYVAAAKSLVREQEIGAWWQTDARPMTGFGALLEANAAALSQWRAGLGKQCLLPEAPPLPRTRRDLAQFSASGEIRAGLRNLARLAILSGRAREARGEYGPALQTYCDVIKFGQDLSRGGLLIDRLVGIAIQAMAHREVRECLAARQAQARDIEELIGRLGALRADRVPLADTIAEEYVYSRQTPLPMRMEESVAGAKRSWAELIQRAKLPYYEAAKLQPVTGRGVMGKTMVPVLDKARAKEAQIQATDLATELLAALELYRLRQGAYPESLDALVPDYLPEMPLDPFAGKAFRYRRTDDNFRLYSVGQNMKDDGGVEPKPGKAGTGDLVFR